MGNIKGRDTMKAHAGQTIIQDSPVDKSSYGHTGNVDRAMKGGIDNLSHSLSGARAEQEANPGRKSSIKEV